MSTPDSSPRTEPLADSGERSSAVTAPPPQSGAVAASWRLWLGCSLLAGLLQFLVGLLLHVLVPQVLPDVVAQYGRDPVFRPWRGLTPLWMAVHPWVYGLLFAGGWLCLQQCAACARGARGGLCYGMGVFVIGSGPVWLLTFTATQIPADIMLLWVLQNLLQYVVAGTGVGCLSQQAAGWNVPTGRLPPVV